MSTENRGIRTRYTTATRSLVWPLATLVAMCLATPQTLRAQGAGRGTITGRVTEEPSGEAVSRAQVVVTGTTLGAVTDDSGRYRIAGVAAGQHDVSARRVGYAPTTKHVTVSDGGTATLDFSLSRSVTTLEQVVTTVTGEQRKKEVGNTIAQLPTDSLLATAPIRNLNEILGARVPGVVVNIASGHTGTSNPIRIRGVSSIVNAATNGTSKDPLIIVDGARIANTVTQSSSGSQGYGQSSGRINDIAPEEIESLDIVKGPAAATLYGTDAANGVIVITTKRGRPGATRWNLYGEQGLIDQPGKWQLNYYSWGRNKTTGAVQQCLVALFAAGGCTIDSLTTYSPLLDPDATIVGTGRRSMYSAQASGGSEALSFFLTGLREGEVGVMRMPTNEQARIRTERGGADIPDEQIRPNTMDKTSARGNLRSAVGKTADVTLSTGLIRTQSRLPAPGTGYNAGYNCPGFKGPTNGWCAGANFTAPGEAFAVRNNEDVTHMIGSATGNWRRSDWLSARSTLGTDFSEASIDALQRNGEGPVGANRLGRRQNTVTSTRLNTADVVANAFVTPRPGLTSRTAVGAQYNRRALHVTTASATGLPPGSETVTGATTITSSETNLESVVAGAYLEQTIGWRERLFLTGAIRADGGSTFGKNFHTAVYPKANLSWLISQEDFMPRLPTVSSLRLRVAYGASGVQPSSTAALPLDLLFAAQVNGAAANGAALSAIGNNDLAPERRSEFETGADVEVFKGRVRFEGTFYSRLATDALIDRPLPASNGITSRQENLGTIRNWGWEGILTGTLLDRRDISLNFTLNAAIQHNRLESLPEGVTFVGIANPAIRSRVGFPLYSRFDRLVTGFADKNGNGIIEPNEVTVTDTIAYGGASAPDHIYTATVGSSFFRDRVRISSQFERRTGVTMMSFGELNRCSFYANCVAANDPHADLWQQARLVARNDPAKGATWGGYFDDASFTRWREASVALQIPGRLLRYAAASGGVLTLSARNLKTWTPYRGPDPESLSNPGLEYVEGPADNPTAPASRYWLLRLSLNY